MDILLYAPYTNSSTTLGETGLTPTTTIWKVLKVSPYTKTEIVSAQTMTELGRGLYYYPVSNVDLSTYDYPGVALTTSTDVVDVEVHMLRWDGSEQWSTELARITANVATETKQDIIDGVVDAILSDTNAILIDTGTTIPADLTLIKGSAFSTTTDSLEAIRDRGDVAWVTGGSSTLTVGEIWEYSSRTLTMSAEEILEIQSGTNISVLRGDTLSIPITGLGSLASRTKLYFTVRKVKSLDDDASEIQIEEAANLLYIGGSSPSTPISATDGTLTVNDETDGDITVLLKPIASTALGAHEYFYDVQLVGVDASVSTKRVGSFTVVQDVTRITT